MNIFCSVESEGEDDRDSEEHEAGDTAVRFKVEEGEAGEDKMRLHRRDTPHHLKNKRVNQQVSGHRVQPSLNWKLLDKDVIFKKVLIFRSLFVSQITKINFGNAHLGKLQ